MGWWEQRVGSEELVIGDEPLDAVDDMLEAVLKAYDEEWERKPTPAELAMILETAIGAQQDTIFDNMEEQEVSSVTIKLKKRPRKQKIAPGDYFAVPLPSGGYGYCQVTDVCITMLVDILDVCSREVLRPSCLRSARPIGRALTDTIAVQDREWPVVGSSPVPAIPPRTRVEAEEVFTRYWLDLGDAPHYRYFPKVVEQTLHDHGCLPR